MALLELLNANPAGTGLADLCKTAGLSKSTAHGLLSTLVDLGYASNEGNEYSPGARIRSLSPAQVDTADTVRALFAPALRAFNEICERDSFLAIPSGTRSYLTLESLDHLGRSLATDGDVRRDAIRTSAIGKVFLANDPAFIRRVRRNAPLDRQLEDELLRVNDAGFALDHGTSRQGLHCMAIPLRYQGTLVGALGISAVETAMDPRWMESKAKQALRQLGSMVSMT